MDEQPINTQKSHWPFSTLDKNPCFSFWPQESLYYQPKQCTINGKSLKITLHLHQVWSSQNLVNSMIPRTPSPNFWKGLLGTCYPNRPNHLKIWSFYIQPSSPPPQKKNIPIPSPPSPLPNTATRQDLTFSATTLANWSKGKWFAWSWNGRSHATAAASTPAHKTKPNKTTAEDPHPMKSGLARKII